MKRHALFVGVNEYTDQNIQRLHCAVNDATELAGFFRYRANFDRAEVLPNPSNCDEVLSRVRALISGMGVGDELLFFFAGHGVMVGHDLRFVCKTDNLDAVKHAWSGLPLGQLKFETAGEFNRLFVLDTCRTDILATHRGVAGIMEGGTRDLYRVTACETDKECGSLTILCSCDEGECAGENLNSGHGIFSEALLEVLDEECNNGRKVLVNEDLVYKQIPDRMRALARKFSMEFNQRPQKEGPPIVILDGKDATSVNKMTSKREEISQPLSPKPSSDFSSVKASERTPSQASHNTKPPREYVITNWTVALDVDMPGCSEKQLMFTLFETLSRYLCLLQGLGRHGEGAEATVFGSEVFRDSAWRLVSGSKKTAMVKCPILTEEDERAIANAGGMEELARQNGVWPIFKEVEMELTVLGEDLKANCKSNPLVRDAFKLVKEVSKSLRNQGEI